MPGARLPMRKIRDVLRLAADGLSKRQIAASLGIGEVGDFPFIEPPTPAAASTAASFTSTRRRRHRKTTRSFSRPATGRW